MGKTSVNAEYSYFVPTGGLVFRIRNMLSQFSDLFSEFNKYIAPAYHHDRCERSVTMRLYKMHKREMCLVFLAFFACLLLTIFIGLSGPPITWSTEISAKELTVNQTNKNNDFLATGPFVIKTPVLTTYSQQLWLIAKMEIDNIDDEIIDKPFTIFVTLDGLTENHTPKPLMTSNRNRTRHLNCKMTNCTPFIVLHRGFLDFSHYIITIRFQLHNFHQRYHINDIKFYFRTYNPAFTQIEIWFRFIFLFSAFVTTCWFSHTLRKYPISYWSLEQLGVYVLLPLLILFDNPLFPLTFLVNSWLPGLLDAVFQTTFLCGLLLFWLCVYHGLRQNERSFLKFYLPKIIVVLPLWVCAINLACQEKIKELQDPTYSHSLDNINYNSFQTLLCISGLSYVIYLFILILKSYSELRSMPYFDLRLKFLTVFMMFVIVISTLVTMGNFGFGLLEDSFISDLNTTYKSSAKFMCFYGLLNFYLYTHAYVYSPDEQMQIERSITKDNPAFSMINDSDSEVGNYDDVRKPLNKNDYDSD
ncbi:transmembrane protein 181 [Culicoides brevitarsis]|uniref:transmembrane protein 181 n=1 Tax=Culicoides brevitarsis TaxID=469753 RepID=UPI00307BCC6A